ncbi:hypothetical protein QYF61_002533 [Mycteria americana]|uniref:Uncharacterized protein n=1 Tax=Mycteria americana TaxID=33587 RepID=A0AAN7S5H3_MYCAM|nr:hypothetical protein QYF61_002533 [Mycteria americana]
MQPIPHSPNSPPIKSISIQFKEKDVVGDHAKGLTEVQIDDILTPSYKATRLIRQDLSLVRPCWLSRMTSLSSMCLRIASRRTCSMIFPGTEFSSSCTLAFLTPSLHNQAASLHSSQDICPCFHCLCISFLPSSLTSRSRLSHAGPLPSFPDFLRLGIESS